MIPLRAPAPLLTRRSVSTLPTGVIDLPRRSIVEILGPASSGRTTLAMTALAASTRAGEVAAVIDTHHSWNPVSAEEFGTRLERVLWVRCQGDAEKAFQATDLVLRAGGFGVVWLDLDAVSAKALSRVPLSYWYRFRRAVENAETTLIAVGRQTAAGNTAHVKYECELDRVQWSGNLCDEAHYRIRPQRAQGTSLSLKAKAG